MPDITLRGLTRDELEQVVRTWRNTQMTIQPSGETTAAGLVRAGDQIRTGLNVYDVVQVHRTPKFRLFVRPLFGDYMLPAELRLTEDDTVVLL